MRARGTPGIGRDAALVLVLVASSLYGREVHADHNFETLYSQVDALVGGLHEAQNEKLVMVGRIDGPYAVLLERALQEALLKYGIQRANTREEVERLRATYKEQGVDVYKDKKFQRLLSESRAARITLELENTCERIVEPNERVREDCILWLHGKLPTALAFSEHRSYTLARPEPPSPYHRYRWFLALLLAYAFVPVLLHRFDIALRHGDGSWRSWLLAPIYLLGNRISVALMILSFLWVGPLLWEEWMVPLDESVHGAGRALAMASGTTLALNFVGAVVVALWRDGKHGLGFFGTLAELFILHPWFWTRRIEAQ